MDLLLKFLAFFIFIIIIIISYIYFIKYNSSTTNIIPKFIKKKLEEKPVQVNNKIIKLTQQEISQNTIKFFNYKHEKFLKNLNNSINFVLIIINFY